MQVLLRKPTAPGAFALDCGCAVRGGTYQSRHHGENTHVDYRSGYLSFIYMDGYRYSVKDERDGYSCTRRGVCTCVNICV